MEGKKWCVLMLLLSTHITPRLQYAVSFIGGEICNEPIQLTTDREQFHQYDGIKINYTSEKITGQVF